MPKPCGECVKAVSAHVLHRKCAIESVVYDVHSRLRELSAYLMGHTGEDCHLKKRAVFVFLALVRNRLVLRYGMQAAQFCPLRTGETVVIRVDHPAERQCGVVCEIVFKAAAVFDAAFYESEVFLLDRLV